MNMTQTPAGNPIPSEHHRPLTGLRHEEDMTRKGRARRLFHAEVSTFEADYKIAGTHNLKMSAVLDLSLELHRVADIVGDVSELAEVATSAIKRQIDDVDMQQAAIHQLLAGINAVQLVPKGE